MTLAAGAVLAAAPPAGVSGRALAMPMAQPATQTIVMEFGDLNTQYDGDGSVDDFMTYNPPHDFITWATNSIRPTVPLRNADIALQSQAKFPFALTGHSPFDPLKVISATLRVDFLFNAARGTAASDTIRFWDESDTTGNYTVGYQFGVRIGHRFCSPFTPACTAEDFPPTWISIDLNLKDGTARVFDLDPITLERTPFRPRPKGAASGCNAQVPVDCPWPFPPLLRDSFPHERGSPADVLRLAADGTLYGMLEDDSALGYVSLTVEAEPLPPVCPTVLDNFNRRDGPLGRSWSGAEGLGSYQIINQQVDVVGDGPINWVRNIFGPSQVACVTLTRVDPDGQHQSLMLKVRGNWRQGAVAVFYNAVAHEIGVETYIPGRGWELQSTVSNIELFDGDQLGARVRDGTVGGTVDVFVNGRKIRETSLHPFFNGKTGRIGLWFIDAADAVLDDFSGGTVTP